MASNTFDIIKLDKNPNMRLNKDYENKLLIKIKDTFTETQQQLFVESFYAYLNYNSKTDFVVDFDKVWKWCGFTRKDSAKKILEKHFTEDVDYKVFRKLAENLNTTDKGGRPTDTIILTINTFKKFCMKANTKKADEIHDYYIKLEEMLHELINQESCELRNQLLLTNEEKNKLDEENKKSAVEIEKLNVLLHKRNKPRVITDEKFVIYLLIAYINGKTIYIVGRTADLNKRYRTYKIKGLLIQEKDIRLAYYKSCRCSAILNLVESCIILKMSKYIMEGCREIFESNEYDEAEMTENFKNTIDFYVNSFEDVSSHIVIGNNVLPEEETDEMEKIPSKDIKEDARIRTELYVEENREEVNEKVREDRKENPQKFQEREKKKDPVKKKEKDKRYYEKHKKEILEKMAEYSKRPENVERIAENKKRHAENKKEEIKERLKNYRVEKKEKIKEQKGKQIKCLCCNQVLTQQCWKRHTTSARHVNAMKENPELVEEFENV